MGHWMIADVDKLDSIFPNNHKQPSWLSLDIAPIPMRESAFEYIVEMFIKHMGY